MTARPIAKLCDAGAKHCGEHQDDKRRGEREEPHRAALMPREEHQSYKPGRSSYRTSRSPSKREIEVGAELHRRERVALLEALRAAKGAHNEDCACYAASHEHAARVRPFRA